MRIHTFMLLAALALVACGGGDSARDADAAEERADTFADDTIAVKDKARERTEAAVEQHREQLEQRLEQDEGAPAAADDEQEPAE